jgi:hypothetical protein
VLVVVEDARPATEAISELMWGCRGTDIEVSLLLDARRGELDEFEDTARMSRGGCPESGRTDTPRQTKLYSGQPIRAMYEQVQHRQRPPPGGHIRGPG